MNALGNRCSQSASWIIVAVIGCLIGCDEDKTDKDAHKDTGGRTDSDTRVDTGSDTSGVTDSDTGGPDGLDAGSDTDTQGDSGMDSEEDSATAMDVITGATPGVASAVLTNAHEGWQQPACLSCHNTFHPSNYAPGDCVSCHGRNGAPLRPTQHDNDGCSDCHGAPHAGLSPDVPDDCRACHGYTASTDECAYTESYDVVVIGGGGGGLAAAATLAQSGASVILLEQLYRVGGCMVAFDRGEYRFEASLHAYDGWGMSYLNALGIGDTLTPVAGDIMYRLVYPDFTFDVPADKDTYAEALKAQFPAEAAHIDTLFDDFGIMSDVDYSGMSLLDVMTFNGIADERLIAVFTVLAGFLAATPDTILADDFSGMWDSYHSMGYNYFVGGSQSITDALEASILSNGGIIRRHTRANRIVVAENRATGVRTEDGGCYSASAVISNASTPATYLSLVGEAYLPSEVVSEVKTRMPAPSTLAMIFLGVDYDYTSLFPGRTHEIFVSQGYEITQDDINTTMCLPETMSYMLTNYSVADPNAAPAGKNAIVITAGGMDYDCGSEWSWGESYDSYEAYKASAAEVLVARAEALLPGLSDHIEVMEVASPRTVEQFTLNPQGSWAGWQSDLGAEHPFTSATETPIDNLFLAGAWVTGAGQSVVLSSGIQAASLARQVIQP